jgi:hypothetical protein
VQEQITGGHLTFRGEHMRIGASFIQTNWNASYEPLPVSYKIFSFRGKSATNAGGDFEARFGSVSLYGELATCAMGGWAFLQGASLDFQHKVYLSLIYRNFGRSYFSPYSSAFAESSVASNERGIFTGLSFKPVQHLLITTYMDVFDFPWLKYRLSQPAIGSDFFIQGQYTGSSKYEFTVRYQIERGFQDSIIEKPGIPPAIEKIREKLRFNIAVTFAHDLTLRSRLELQLLEQAGLKTERGYLLYQDVDYKFPGIPLKLVGRFSLFETDSYNSRIYGYESDMLHVYSVPAFSGKGMRYSLLAQCKIGHRFDLWIKLGRNLYPEQTKIGTAASQINSNHKTDLGIELRAKF